MVLYFNLNTTIPIIYNTISLYKCLDDDLKDPVVDVIGITVTVAVTAAVTAAVLLVVGSVLSTLNG